jgi:hypothetical protein
VLVSSGADWPWSWLNRLAAVVGLGTAREDHGREQDGDGREVACGHGLMTTPGGGS